MNGSGGAKGRAPGGPLLELPSDLQEFDANTFPLEPGIRLLEASAGTGKTFALAHLVLRLVADRGISLRRLLVVTFTDAAAAELRHRIGRRLQQALTALEHPGAEPPDAVLGAWRERVGADGEANARLRGRLLLALEELDAADITTIHGFCRRSLLRQALEAGLPPDLRLESDADPLIHQVVHDYWQTQVLPLPPELVAGLRARGVRPEALRTLLQILDGDPALRLDPLPPALPADRPLPEGLPALWNELWQRFRREWTDRSRELELELRDQALRWKDEEIPCSPYSPNPRTDRCGDVDGWLLQQGEVGTYEAVLGQRWLLEYFHPDAFARVARRSEGPDRPITLPQAPLMQAVADLVDAPAERVLRHLGHWGRAELRRRRQRNGSVGFSQLLEALDPGVAAEAPTPLLEAVGERYDVALIDEFQDTDPVQWRILRLAFGLGRHQLVMVGDPKQAIYRFRGGDLATYRRARAHADARFSLIENRRSTPALIEGLNRLMTLSGLPRSELPVPEVRARAERSGPDGPPLELLWLGADRPAGAPLPTSSALDRDLPERIAAHCAALLAEAPTLTHGGRERSLGADDLCLLVSNHRQAERLRGALERRRIASRLVSRADVFASPTATALQRFLDALADPADPNRLRLLAASPLLGWSAADLARDDPRRWSALAGQLARLADRLEARGLLGALADLLDSEALAGLALGGRLLADLQQVAALVQERLHADRLGPRAAADWLRRLRLDPDRLVPEEHRAHSDRVDGAVSVVTIHASKGLEYPVVICPYLWQSAGGRRAPARPGTRWQPPGSPEPVLSLHRSTGWGPGHAAALQNLEAEEAERERLAYVAATRAQHRLVLAWGPAQDQSCNPLFPWLFPGEPLPAAGDDPLRDCSDADWRQRLEEGIARRGLPLLLRDLPPADAVAGGPLPLPPEAPLATGPVPLWRLDRGWGRSSYTSWTRAAHGDGAAATPLALDEGRDTGDPEAEERPADAGALEGEGRPSLPADEGWPDQGPLAGFPRGAAAGDCLHRILEQLDYREAAAAPANRAVVERELRRAGFQDLPPEPILEGLERVLATPFGGSLGALRVSDLAPGRWRNEMNFDLTLGFARAEALAAAFADHPGGAFGATYADRVARLPVASRGFLTGSIDLVFTAPGDDGETRWWVADWKSNWLGRRDPEGTPQACGPRHYGPVAMAELMAASHYPLQAHLYLVALHRYLGWRLPGYDPARHLGGYAYVFLRGTPGAAGLGALPGPVPGMFVEQPPLERLLALDGALAAGDPGGAPPRRGREGRP